MGATGCGGGGVKGLDMVEYPANVLAGMGPDEKVAVSRAGVVELSAKLSVPATSRLKLPEAVWVASRL